MTIEQIAHRIREEHAKYAHKEGMDWAMLAAAKIKAEMQPAKRLTDEEIHRLAVMDNVDAEQAAYLEEISKRGIYLDGMTHGLRYARDNGYLGGLTVEEVMDEVEDFIEEGIDQISDHSSDHGFQYDRGHRNWDATMNDLRTRLTTKLSSK